MRQDRSHTFVHQFGQFRATTTINIMGDQGHLMVLWEPHTPDQKERLPLVKEYTTWLLDCYKVMANETGVTLGYYQSHEGGHAWSIKPDGTVTKVLEKGKKLT